MNNNLIVKKSSLITCPHGFSTRIAGVSTGIFESLNLGMNRGDKEENVSKNWELFLKECQINEKAFVCGAQVHGNKVSISTKEDCRSCYEKYDNDYLERKKNNDNYKFSADNLIEADGYVTNQAGVPLAIFTADCTPLLMHDPVNNVIAAVHCGWRSTALDIMKNAIDNMILLGAKKDNIKAAIGPAICSNCFEVGSEVIDAMTNLLGYNPENLYKPSKNNSLDSSKYLLDLKGVVAKRLIQLGLNESNIDDINECTMCQPDIYWSHRITGFNRGSQANVIML